MVIEAGERIDLDAYEPVFEGEEDGLLIKGYEIEGQFVLDFDWEPGGKWAFLDDEAQFKQFTVGLLERLTGVAMASVDVDQLQFAHQSAEQPATSEPVD